MSKRKKPIRNEFTDALSEEIAARKIVERTQPNFSSETKVEIVVEEPKVENVIEKVEVVDAIPNIEVKPETKLEERIFAESDNTFYDDKPAKKSTVNEKLNQSTYRSKALRKWQEDIESEEPTPNPVEDVKEEPRRKLSRAEKAGLVISVAMMVYSFITLDKPLFFLAFSLFVHLLRTPLSKMCGKYEQPVQNAMRSFSMVLFFGAILFLFLNV